ncbi:MAG TPA: hemolysin family protein, partial [Kofleriaceae bacterium]|nr:hemolysin family protein [Kofleriaceae bacterium]
MIALLLFILAATVATLCAAADGALLATEGRSAPGAGIEGERAHRALGVARLLTQVTAGAALAVLLEPNIHPRWLGVPVALLFTALFVTLTESMPRAIGDARAASLRQRMSGVIHAADSILRPATAVTERLDRTLRRIIVLGADTDESHLTTTAQFRQVVAAEADVSRDDQSLLLGVFSLGDTEVHEIMVPRVDIVGIELDTPWSEMLDRVRSSEHARFPVFVETLDDIAGILYAKDLLPSVIADEHPERGWNAFVRPAVFIPATKTIDSQLRDFQASRTHIAIVVDEYGGTAGLVTIEDILEEIVGEIQDEYDVEEPAIERENGRRFWVSGKVTLDELSDNLGHDFRHEQVTTVGGLLYEMLGRVPRAGESLAAGPYRIVVERMAG